MARPYRRHSVEFKRHVVQEYRSGEESLHGLATRHDVCRNLIRVWIEKFEAGAYDEDQEAASSLRQHQAKIAALERKVGQLTMELDLLKKGQCFARRPRSGPSSIVSGPPLERAAAASAKDAAS
jgi:transposase-like protein